MGHPTFSVRFAKAVYVLCLVNFLTFAMVAESIGGDASNGHSAGGHYFLAAHGRIVEVSEVLYTYSLIHIFSAFAGLLIALCAAIWVSRKTRAHWPRWAEAKRH